MCCQKDDFSFILKLESKVYESEFVTELSLEKSNNITLGPQKWSKTHLKDLTTAFESTLQGIFRVLIEP